jgi:hypothetical protein
MTRVKTGDAFFTCQGTRLRYNRVVKKLALIIAVLFLAACSKDIQNTEAVRQGVVDYLQQRTAETGLDVNSLVVTVSSVSFEQDVARATVAFSPKSAPGATGMSMNYVLDRKGDKWVVKGRQIAPGNPHGAVEMPPGHPAAGPGQ